MEYLLRRLLARWREAEPKPDLSKRRKKFVSDMRKHEAQSGLLFVFLFILPCMIGVWFLFIIAKVLLEN